MLACPRANERSAFGQISRALAEEFRRLGGVIRLSTTARELCVRDDGTIGCLYEKDGYKRITFARFPLEWVQPADARGD